MFNRSAAKIRIMKKFLFLLILFVFAISAMADDLILQIWQSDGKVVTIDLNEQPVTRYSDGNLIITTTKSTISYPLEKVAKYTYALADGISTIEGMRTKFSQDGETITFFGLKQGTEITVYSPSGQIIRKTKAGAQSETIVSVSNLIPGVYIVKANGVTYKITKR